MDLELVEEPGAEVLLDDVRAARDLHVLVAGSGAGLLERGLDAVGDEREGRPLQLERFARMVREDEDGMAERRLVTPPAVRFRIVLPRARRRC